MDRKEIIVLFFVLVVCVSAVGAVDVEFPLIQSMGYFPYQYHDILEPKAVRMTLDVYHSNIYTFDFFKSNINDMELSSGAFGFEYGLSRRVTLEFYVRAAVAWGGVMDKLIMDFHDLFNMSQGGREEFPRNQVLYTYKDAFSYGESSLNLSPLVLGARMRLFESGRFRFNGRLSVGVPLSSKPGFSGGKPFFSGGVMVLYSGKNEKLAASWATHLSFYGLPKWLEGEDVKTVIWHSEVRLDYKWLFGGVLVRGTPFKFDELSNAAWQVYAGVKFLKVFELALVEEMPPMDTTPDVTFLLRIKLKMN
jgi:hypothetical protein